MLPIMARPLRIEYPGAYYHVMNRGLSRRHIFIENQDRKGFLDLIGDLSRLWKVEVYAYCLMDTHVHLLLGTPLGGLSRAMRHLDGIYTQRFNRAHRRDGPLFRGRYKAILIDAEDYFLSVARYIHQNPVKAGLVSNMDHYRWSSHQGYVDRKKGPDWLNTETLLSRFSRGRMGLGEYQEYMHAPLEKEIAEYYSKQYYKPVLGGKEFVEWVMEKVGAKVEEEKPESRRVFRPELEEIVEATATYYGKTMGELKKRRRGHENEARGMAMYLGRRLGGYKLTEIGRAMGVGKYSTVSSACLVMKERVERDRGVARRAKQIEQSLSKGHRRI